MPTHIFMEFTFRYISFLPVSTHNGGTRLEGRLGFSTSPKGVNDETDGF